MNDYNQPHSVSLIKLIKKALIANASEEIVLCISSLGALWFVEFNSNSLSFELEGANLMGQAVTCYLHCVLCTPSFRPKSHLLYGEDTAAVRPLN